MSKPKHNGFGSFFNIFELKEEFRAEDNCNGRWNARRVVSNNRRDVGHAAEASGQNVALTYGKECQYVLKGRGGGKLVLSLAAAAVRMLDP